MTDPQAELQPPASMRPVGDGEMDLLDYLPVIWRRRWMILALCLVASGLTVVVTLRKPRQYQAAATIVPPLETLQRESAGTLGLLNSSLLRQAIDTTAGSIARIYMEILGSREVADSIVDRFHLRDLGGDPEYRVTARDRLKANTRLKVADGGVVKIAVTDTDPNRAAAIANAYIEELDRQNKRLSAGQATSKRVFLENRLKEIEGKLSQIDSILSREAKAQETLYELLVPQCEMAKIEESKSMPTIQILDSAVVPELPLGRAVIRKALLATVAAFMFGAFAALSYESVVRAHRLRSEVRAAGKRGPQGSVSGGEPGSTQAKRLGTRRLEWAERS